jgi:hypothetical protein
LIAGVQWETPEDDDMKPAALSLPAEEEVAVLTTVGRSGVVVLYPRVRKIALRQGEKPTLETFEIKPCREGHCSVDLDFYYVGVQPDDHRQRAGLLLTIGTQGIVEIGPQAIPVRTMLDPAFGSSNGRRKSSIRGLSLGLIQ